jgi:hypothetical protein
MKILELQKIFKRISRRNSEKKGPEIIEIYIYHFSR